MFHWVLHRVGFRRRSRRGNIADRSRSTRASLRSGPDTLCVAAIMVAVLATWRGAGDGWRRHGGEWGRLRDGADGRYRQRTHCLRCDRYLGLSSQTQTWTPTTHERTADPRRTGQGAAKGSSVRLDQTVSGRVLWLDRLAALRDHQRPRATVARRGENSVSSADASARARSTRRYPS